MKDLGILGSSGFIGNELSNLLHINGISFYGVSRKKFNNNFPNLVINNFEKIPHFKKIVFLAENNIISNAENLGEDYIEESKIKVINAINATEHSFIYASSASIYESKNKKLLKTNDPLNLNSIYARSKKSCEEVVLKNGGTVIRISNVFGVGMSKKNLISELFRKIKLNKFQIKVRNKTSIRDYINVKDLSNLLLKVIENPKHGIYNAGTSKGLSVEEIFNFLKKTLNKKDLKLVENNPLKSHSSIILDIESTQNDYQWKPESNFFDSLKTIITQL